jgi:MATE family multidrug resistance protein
MRPFLRRHPVLRDVAADPWILGGRYSSANLALAGMPLADTLMAGYRLGAHGLAAAAVGSSFYGLCMYCGLGVMTSLSPLAAHAYGAGDYVRVGPIRATGLLDHVVGVCAVAGGYFGP